MSPLNLVFGRMNMTTPVNLSLNWQHYFPVLFTILLLFSGSILISLFFLKYTAQYFSMALVSWKIERAKERKRGHVNICEFKNEVHCNITGYDQRVQQVQDLLLMKIEQM